MSDSRAKIINSQVKEWYNKKKSEKFGVCDVGLLAASLDKITQRESSFSKKYNERVAELLLKYLDRNETGVDARDSIPLKIPKKLSKKNPKIKEHLQLVLNEYYGHLEAVRDMRKLADALPKVSSQKIILYAELGANYGFHKAVLKTAQTLVEEKHECTVVYEDNAAYFEGFTSGKHFFIKSGDASPRLIKEIYAEGGFSVTKDESGLYKLCWGVSDFKGTIQRDIDLSASLTEKDGAGWERREESRKAMLLLLDKNFALLEKDGLKLAAKKFDSDVIYDDLDKNEKDKAENATATMDALIAYAQTHDNYPEAFVGFGENAFDMISKKDKTAKEELDSAGVTWVSKTDWERGVKSKERSAAGKIVILTSSEQMGDYLTQEKISRQSASRRETFPDAALVYLQPLCWHGGRAIIMPGEPPMDVDLCFTALGAIPKNPTPALLEVKASELDTIIDKFKGTVVNVYGIHQVNQPPDSVEQLLLNVKTALEAEGRGPVIFVDTTPSKELASPAMLKALNIEFANCDVGEFKTILEKKDHPACHFVKMKGYLPQSSLDIMLRKSPLGVFSGSNSMESLLSLGNKGLVPIHAGGMDMPDTWELDSKAISELSHAISHVDDKSEYTKPLGRDESLSARKKAYVESCKDKSLEVLTPAEAVVKQLRQVIKREKCPLVDYQEQLQKCSGNPLNDQLSVCLAVATQRRQRALDHREASVVRIAEAPSAIEMRQGVSSYRGALLPAPRPEKKAEDKPAKPAKKTLTRK